jgi:hypothetical protein
VQRVRETPAEHARAAGHRLGHLELDLLAPTTVVGSGGEPRGRAAGIRDSILATLTASPR